jgi:hypothetical protein
MEFTVKNKSGKMVNVLNCFTCPFLSEEIDARPKKARLCEKTNKVVVIYDNNRKDDHWRKIWDDFEQRHGKDKKFPDYCPFIKFPDYCPFIQEQEHTKEEPEFLWPDFSAAVVFPSDYLKKKKEAFKQLIKMHSHKQDQENDFIDIFEEQ